MARRKAAIQENEEAQAQADAAKKDRKLSKDRKNGKGLADSQSHFASQKGGIRSRGTHQESNATLAQVSEGEDLNSLASGVTGSRKALNINVQSASLNKQNSNAASSSKHKLRKGSKPPQTLPTSTKAGRGGERAPG